MAKQLSPIFTANPFVGKTSIHVIVETPKGKRNKFKFDEEWGCFRLGKVLPVGAMFPYDFGFIPGTKGEDGDPLDVLLLMDEPTFPGCLVKARIVGIIEAEQSKKRKKVRNDRVIAVAEEAQDYGNIHTVRDLNPHLLREVEHFFQSYNQAEGKEFRVIATRGPRNAIAAIKRALRKE
jgi:inorganic pyrophosphatase